MLTGAEAKQKEGGSWSEVRGMGKGKGRLGGRTVHSPHAVHEMGRFSRCGGIWCSMMSISLQSANHTCTPLLVQS